MSVRETSVLESDCPGNVLYGKRLSRKRLSGKRLVRETSVRESDCPGNVCKAKILCTYYLNHPSTMQYVIYLQFCGLSADLSPLAAANASSTAGQALCMVLHSTCDGEVYSLSLNSDCLDLMYRIRFPLLMMRYSVVFELKLLHCIYLHCVIN